MVVKTEAIVLNLQRHSDRSHILYTYTRAQGRLNFLVYGVGSKKKSGAFYAPLTLLEITADIRPDRPISTIKEVRLLQQPNHFNVEIEHSELVRSSVKMFLAEFLYRTLKHPMPDDALFDFLYNSLRMFDNSAAIGNFHVDFLVGFAARLGFAIDEAEHPELLRIPASRADRQLLLRQLCDYFAANIEDFHTPVSLDVLMEVFD